MYIFIFIPSSQPEAASRISGLRVFLFHRYTDRAGYLQRTSSLQLEGALLLCSCCGRTVRISWPHEREPCVVGKWAAAGMVGGRGWTGWTGVGGLVDWWRASPGGLGGVSLFIAWRSRACEISSTESLRLAGHKLQHRATLPVRCR